MTGDLRLAHTCFSKDGTGTKIRSEKGGEEEKDRFMEPVTAHTHAARIMREGSGERRLF